MAEVRFYPTTLDRSTISAKDLLDIQIMKVGADQFKSAKMRIDEFQSATNPYKKFELTIEETDVRILNTLNGGFGIELLPPIDDQTTYDIVNPVIIFDIGLVGFSIADTLQLYFQNQSVFYSVNTDTTPSVKYAQQMDFNFRILPHSESVYIKLNNSHSDFQGKIRIEFEYRKINLTL